MARITRPWAREWGLSYREKMDNVLEDMIKKKTPNKPWDDQLREFRAQTPDAINGWFVSWADTKSYTKFTWLLGRKAMVISLQWIFLHTEHDPNKAQVQSNLRTYLRNLVTFSLIGVYWKLWSEDFEQAEEKDRLVAFRRHVQAIPSQQRGVMDLLPPRVQLIPCYLRKNTRLRFPGAMQYQEESEGEAQAIAARVEASQPPEGEEVTWA